MNLREDGTHSRPSAHTHFDRESHRVRQPSKSVERSTSAHPSPPSPGAEGPGAAFSAAGIGALCLSLAMLLGLGLPTSTGAFGGVIQAVGIVAFVIGLNRLRETRLRTPATALLVVFLVQTVLVSIGVASAALGATSVSLITQIANVAVAAAAAYYVARLADLLRGVRPRRARVAALLGRLAALAGAGLACVLLGAVLLDDVPDALDWVTSLYAGSMLLAFAALGAALLNLHEATVQTGTGALNAD